MTGHEPARDDTDADREPPDVLRPLGYVEPEPVARRVVGGLYVGNGHAADPDRHGSGTADPDPDRFEHVLTVATEERPRTTHHRPLEDGPNDWPAFAAAVDTARRLHRREGALLIHCTAGISRSSAVAATALAAEDDRPLRDALGTVQRARPVAMPHPALHELAVVYLAARGR